tara:strand:- start:99 stop:587 length:489 start_codon:yes stop_codon:yes gene_type:complete
MEEIVFRRYSRLINEKKSLPQLIIVDGGKGQLSSAIKSLKKLNLQNKIAIIGIAKRLEEIYFPNDPIPLYLDKKSETLKVIQNLRNEAHRFAIKLHRNKRSKNIFASNLDNIKGIGEKTKIKLIKDLKSFKKIKKASKKELINSIGKSKAEILHDFINSNYK